MARLLVLGYDVNTSKYRGVNRAGFPDFAELGTNEKIINNAFIELENGVDYLSNEGPFITDLDLAERVARAYSLNKSGQVFEVVELVYPFEEPKIMKSFLGFDIIVKDEGFDSILPYLYSDRIDFNSEQLKIKSRYSNVLNANLLFSNLSDAFSFYEDYSLLLEEGLSLMIIGVYN